MTEFKKKYTTKIKISCDEKVIAKKTLISYELSKFQRNLLVYCLSLEKGI
jgi:hypothetical protein